MPGPTGPVVILPGRPVDLILQAIMVRLIALNSSDPTIAALNTELQTVTTQANVTLGK